MKDHLIGLIANAADAVQARNLAREYLQARILGAMQRAGAMMTLAFMGGTALRFLFALPRYSEDLDFSLEAAGADEPYDFRRILRAIQTELTRENYAVEIKANDQRTVNSAFVKFAGLPRDLGLSPHASEILSVKIEVDTKPPAGARTMTTLVRRHEILRLRHHDKSTLLAGKLHAILQRPHPKGRDWYDLLWYLSDPEWPAPNLILLNNALAQTGWDGKPLSEATWAGAVERCARAVEWSHIQSDVRPFLQRSTDIDALTRKNVLQVLRQHRR